jgi:hypothetical protein
LVFTLIPKVPGHEIYLSSYIDTVQIAQKQYFSNFNYGAQLENYMGTKSLSFEFPGKNAHQLF